MHLYIENANFCLNICQTIGMIDQFLTKNRDLLAIFQDNLVLKVYTASGIEYILFIYTQIAFNISYI